jgi:hypothetical protein
MNIPADNLNMVATFAAALPIAGFKDEIIASIDKNQVTIITAETGAGKSTQVPQYLAEHGYEKIIITQPRILAARNLSLRVRDEWTGRHGGERPEQIGFRTARERDDTEDTVILYCTDGLQLVREVVGLGTTKNQVLILDEIHEWNQNMEVLIAWAKKRCLEDKTFKLVVMSATIEAESLASYFGAGMPITVPGRSFPIAMRHGEDLIREIVSQLEKPHVRNLLVFLPGKSEIENVLKSISYAAETRNVPIFPLHSQLLPEEQQLVFAHHPQGKVILSTNIAQTSITIDDIDMVIDSGLERRIHIENGVEGLFIAQVSRADSLQRAGRAGRTKNGDYILASYERMPCLPIDSRPAYAMPEILRTHLDRVILRLANVGIDIEELEFFHAPSIPAIQHAKQTLQNLHAITETDTITPIGQRMERYPVESRYARMLVESEGFSNEVRQKLAAVIAIQEVGGIIRGGSKYLGWRKFTNQTKSDLLAQYEVYLALPALDPIQLEDLGIVAQNVAKAAETFEHLCYELSLPATDLLPLAAHEIPALMKCIVTGHLDQIWIVEGGGMAAHISGNSRREISGGTVVKKDTIVAGTPFNLEISTAFGFETLHLVQDLTGVEPTWLEEAEPTVYSVSPGKVTFDGHLGSLVRRWRMKYKGTEVKGIQTVVTEVTPQNRQLFLELFGAWVAERLEDNRRAWNKGARHKVPAVPLGRLHERLQHIVNGAISLEGLNDYQFAELGKLTNIKTYIKDTHHGEGKFRRKKH